MLSLLLVHFGFVGNVILLRPGLSQRVKTKWMLTLKGIVIVFYLLLVYIQNYIMIRMIRDSTKSDAF